ncbi:putative acyltransferase [Gottschalkia purinilytica]|uniref:Putative acyltransferase n=1 Tax=Gottschalkia purinilytica TaxID=1503 RepID=A0A0L0W9R4_GOTPU|nr:GNAT family N-acetyltransferase [Gottschalkia purinilytica]KNF08274.1 putative acyltransferase [Gottschalkia purinilytica]
MQWEIKTFQDLEILELYNIIKERIDVFVVEQNCPYTECDNKDIEAFHLMLKDKDNIIAYLRILPKGVSYEEVSLGRIMVSDGYRGEGYAKEMMLKAIKFVEEEMEETKIRISAQNYLVDFYKSFGFNIVSDIYLEDSIPHVEMFYEK